MENKLCNESTEEEVVKFFVDNASISEEIQNKIKTENITGEILPLLSKDEFTKQIGLKFGERKKWETYFKNNPDKFKEKEITEKILPNSTQEEVKTFLEKCLDFKDPVNNIDGKQLLELNEEEMEKMGLTLGKRKKLTKYITYFKTLIPKERTEDLDVNLLITRKSSRDDVANFLKTRLKLSQDSINEIKLDGETLYDMEEDEVEELRVSTEEKEQLKSFLKRLKSSEEPQKTITKESGIEEVADFLNKSFGIPKNIIQELKLDGENFLNTTEDDIKEFEISEEQKNRWIKYLKELNSGNEVNIKEGSSKEEVKNFLKKNLSFSDISLQLLNLDGKAFLLLKEFQIKNLNISKEEKQRLITYLKKDQIKLENNENSIIHFLDDKFGYSINNFNEEDLLKISKELKEEEKKILENWLKSLTENQKEDEISSIKKSGKVKDMEILPSLDRQFNTLQNYKINPPTKNNNYNVIFFLTIKESLVNYYCYSIYEELSKDCYINYKPNVIYELDVENKNKESNKILYIQIQSKEEIHRLNIVLKDINVENESFIEIKYINKCYYHLDNLKYDTFNYLEELPIHNIIDFYCVFIFDVEKNVDKMYKIQLLYQLFDFINDRYMTSLYAESFLLIFKQSLNLGVRPKNINSIRIREIETGRKIKLEKFEYLTDNEIQKLNLGEYKSKFCELIVSLYANSDKNQLIKLIKSPNGKDYCAKVLDLIRKKKLQLADFFFNKR